MDRVESLVQEVRSISGDFHSSVDLGEYIHSMLRRYVCKWSFTGAGQGGLVGPNSPSSASSYLTHFLRIAVSNKSFVYCRWAQATFSSMGGASAVPRP